MSSGSPLSAERLSADLRSCPVMAVFRGLSPVETARRAHVAWDVGVRVVEVPIESESADPSLRAAVEAGAERGMAVGAGTVVTAERLHAARELGAAYAVSPGLDPALIEQAHATGVTIIPGVATASEILRAHSLGVTWVKGFPASVLGPEWFRAMRGPFPDLSIIATGGVTETNAQAFLRGGATVVGLGSVFADRETASAIAQLVAEHPMTGAHW